MMRHLCRLAPRRHWRALAALILTVASLAATPFAQTAEALDLSPQLDPLARKMLEGHVAVGFVVGILKDGQTQVIGYGETRKGGGARPNGDTVYEIGSLTKTFTGTLLADQMLRGAMQVDAPVQTFLPLGVTMPAYGGEPITLAQLATHTSGLPRRPTNMKRADPANPYADYTVEQLYVFLNSHTLARPPGKYEYSNLGMGLLGHVVGLQAGATHDQLVRERIAGPLGMGDTAAHPDARMTARLAPPYDRQLRPVKSWDLPTLAGAGGLRSTVNDLLKYARGNLTRDDTPLSKAMQLAHQKRFTDADGRGFGLGWRISRNGMTLSHTGLTGGYRAWLAVVPRHKLAVVVLGNSANVAIIRFGDQVTLAAIGPLRPGTGTPAPGRPEAPEGDPEEADGPGEEG